MWLKLAKSGSNEKSDGLREYKHLPYMECWFCEYQSQQYTTQGQCTACPWPGNGQTRCYKNARSPYRKWVDCCNLENRKKHANQIVKLVEKIEAKYVKE